MADSFNVSNSRPDNGRGFISSILQKLPYANTVQDVDQDNPKYELFNRITKNRDHKIMTPSMTAWPPAENIFTFSFAIELSLGSLFPAFFAVFCLDKEIV